ncbi:peptide-N4-asparagine amidase [Actinoplanes sp. NPDC051411]|uniref:peptide-N4-asparagine amidase n=1 Tax=Actinoplanes sp. NPDC051411 TaxID=3155522 RepID=UPI003418E3F4
MRRSIAVVAGLLLALAGAPAAHAAAPVPVFGSDWDNPRTAAPAIAKPPTRSCSTTIVDHAFDNYDVYAQSYAAPCRGPWAKVVLRLDGSVAGRQYDRLGWLTMGGVEIFKTSTPEPSPDGIQWSVEKDVTAYSALLERPQTVNMYLGNTVDDTYTGVLKVKVTLTFYAAVGPSAVADDVLPLADQHTDGQDLAGTVIVPRDTERLLAEVYATGSGGGCEEFWYLTAPSPTGYSCPADPGPYREVQVLVDGQVAGIAAPFPHVYTGGWSNPYLWYVLPAPRAFDIRPITYDLSPFLGRLTDGAAHAVSVHVVGVPAGQGGWDTPINFLGWRDPSGKRVTGALVGAHLSTLTDDVTTGPGRVGLHASHTFVAGGYLRTSHGLITTTVSQRVGNDSIHSWGDGENPDALTATWTDDVTGVVAGRSRFAGVTRVADRYGLDGRITVDAGDRLTTTLTVTDAGLGRSDIYRGSASYLAGAPRDQRQANGTSEERYRQGRYDRTVRTRNGFVVEPD